MLIFAVISKFKRLSESLLKFSSLEIFYRMFLNYILFKGLIKHHLFLVKEYNCLPSMMVFLFEVFFKDTHREKKYRQVKLQGLQKVRIWVFGSLVHQINP